MKIGETGYNTVHISFDGEETLASVEYIVAHTKPLASMLLAGNRTIAQGGKAADVWSAMLTALRVEQT